MRSAAIHIKSVLAAVMITSTIMLKHTRLKRAPAEATRHIRWIPAKERSSYQAQEQSTIITQGIIPLRKFTALPHRGAAMILNLL